MNAKINSFNLYFIFLNKREVEKGEGTKIIDKYLDIAACYNSWMSFQPSSMTQFAK